MCFKQKTAYEMRISDWSSDVCSSDLTRRRTGEAGEEAGDHGLRTAGDDGTRRAVVGLPDLALRAAARAAGDRAFPPDPSPSQAPVAPPDRRHPPRCRPPQPHLPPAPRATDAAARAAAGIRASERRPPDRSAERRVGKEGVRTVKSRWYP